MRLNEDLSKSFIHERPDLPGKPPTSRPGYNPLPDGVMRPKPPKGPPMPKKDYGDVYLKIQHLSSLYEQLLENQERIDQGIKGLQEDLEEIKNMYGKISRG